jgi:hypothetical protein
MTFPLNLTLSCYYFKTLLLPRDVNSLRRCYVNKNGGGVNDLFLNLTLTCYYFETLLSRDVNSPRRCYVNKDGGGVNDLSCKPNFDLLF